MKMGIKVVSLLLLCVCGNVSAGTPARQDSGRVWPSEPPPGIPFATSTELAGIEFTGRCAHYGDADTWFPTWASNGNLYSSWTDGKVNGVASSSFGPKATTGYATILGDDPLLLIITHLGTYAASPLPYGGRYPAGGLVYDGVWYYGTYLLDRTPGKGLNWDILGPFVGFRYSTDLGKTWHASPHSPQHPLFDEPAKKDGPVKLGLPHFVDFGKNMKYSPDGKAYIVSQGAAATDPSPRDANLSWITGDQIYLARVKPSTADMNRRSAYEYFAGHDKQGRVRWTRDFSRIEPLIEWNNHTGNVSVTYDAPLKKYLMAVTDGGNTIGKYNTYILESSQIAGPWRLVTYMRNHGCPVKSRTESVVWEMAVTHLGNRTSEVPVKWGFSQKG
ncbi:MAG: hypothetical protein WCE63_02525 [Acidobacteriaceae bacterium]